MPYSTQLVQEMASKDQETTFWAKQNSLKRDQFAEARKLQGAILHLATNSLSSRSWKKETRLREICVERKFKFTFHLASQFAQAMFKDWSQLA